MAASYGFSVFDVFGFVGVILYLAAYTALQLGLMRGQGYMYAFLNAGAAGLILLSLQDAFNLSSAIIQISWIAISLVGTLRYYILTHRIRFSDEETRFLNSVVPNLDRIKARRLIDLGSWFSDEPDTELTEAGQLVNNLIYLSEGQAKVVVGDTVVATLDGNSLIGEMTALSGVAASATVTLAEPSRYLAIPIQPLRRLLERDDDIRRHVQASFTDQMSAKLVKSNIAKSESARPS